MPKEKAKGIDKLVEALIGVAPDKRKEVLSALKESTRKIVERRLHIKDKEKLLEEKISKSYHYHEHYKKTHKDYGRLSAFHKKILGTMIKGNSFIEAKKKVVLEQKSDELYSYYKSRGKKTGVPPAFFKDMDTTDRHLVVMQADQKFDAFAKYQYFFKKHKLDEEPSFGVPPSEMRFFMDAKIEHMGKGPVEEVKIHEKGTKEELKQKLLKDAEFVKLLGNGDMKKGTEKIKELTRENWYRKSALSDLEVVALKRMGYIESQKNVWDFENSLSSIVAYNSRGFTKESLHHFSKAYFARELIPTIIIRQKIPGTDKEVDAAIPTSKKGKVAIEFQESHTLGPQKVIEKVKPITENFDNLIIVCKEDEKEKYAHVRSNKVFVLNNKEFVDFIKEIAPELSSSKK